MTDNTNQDRETRLIIASGNKGKVGEFSTLLRPLGLKIAGLENFLAERGLSLPEPEENGETFLENASVKARYYADALKVPALADDSGLCVKALGGAPGVRSARYGGEKASFSRRFELLLTELKGVRDREAFFQAVLVLARPGDSEILSWEGRLEGLIAEKPAGDDGFGYDPVFYVPELSRTLAQMSPAEKNLISHRGRAAALMLRDKEKVRLFINDSPEDPPFLGS
ncbi:MAG: RdgB/HAM1 family non-canonical purine NTP pyrophosphatase [Deltaproteobacteria bacterium]|jgi:XTP/dITP diphosphohydrolase|nr:RdgB/HAM1 family non-canonical purine NTP pyrophosphatase [Deltaproteobacteria bacterium]